MNSDLKFMRAALKEAAKAEKLNEVPIGAIIVFGGKIIARGHNLRETTKDPLGHAEMMAIKKASKKLGEWRLIETIIYVTLEPCPMCAGAILNSRIPRIVFGAKDPKGGALGSSFNLFEQPNLNHRPQIVGGVLEAECSLILKEFFKNKR